MAKKRMRLSSKNAIFVYPKTLDVMRLLDDKFNKELHSEIFGIVIQPDGRRVVIYLTRKTAGELAYNLMTILSEKTEKRTEEIQGGA